MTDVLKVQHLRVIEGDARIGCRDVAQALGFARVEALHRLIERNRAELEGHGEVFRHGGGILRHRGEIIGEGSAAPKAAKRGQPQVHYLLNEPQAILVCMFARTPAAAAVRRQIVEVFLAWRRGQQPPAAPAGPVRTRDVFAAARDRVTATSQIVAQLRAAQPAILELTNLPIWKNGRRPKFWSDIDVRTLLTTMHRQMTIQQAWETCLARFGAARTPCKSALHEYWQRLDSVYGPGSSGRDGAA